MDIFVQTEYFGYYELFLLPALRVSAMLLVPILYGLFVQETFWIRGFYIVAIVALPFALASVYILVVLNIGLAAILVTSGVFCGIWLATIFGAKSPARQRG